MSWRIVAKISSTLRSNRCQQLSKRQKSSHALNVSTLEPKTSSPQRWAHRGFSIGSLAKGIQGKPLAKDTTAYSRVNMWYHRRQKCEMYLLLPERYRKGLHWLSESQGRVRKKNCPLLALLGYKLKSRGELAKKRLAHSLRLIYKTGEPANGINRAK